MLGNLGQPEHRARPPWNRTRAIRGCARDPSRHRRAGRGGPDAGQHRPARPGSRSCRGRAKQFLRARWRSRAMRATAARRVSSSVAWALWKAKTGSSTRRACTTTRRSPSIAPSAIVAAKGVVLAQLADLLARQGRDEEARALLAQAEAHLRAVGETLDLAGLLCLRGRLELAAGEPERARRSLAGGEHRCRSPGSRPRRKAVEGDRRAARGDRRGASLLLDDVGAGRRQ